MAAQSLTAFLHGKRVGVFSRDSGKYSFTFDEDWSNNSRLQQLSRSMPKSQDRHTGPHVENFLQGLLPENSETLNRWAARFDVRADNPMSLLEHVGLDCAGAIQLTTDSGTMLERDGGVDPVTAEDIARHLKALDGDSSDWALPSNHGGQFSLAGAQAKFALIKTADGWGVPWGNAATTHIVKPGVSGMAGQNVVEHLTMAVAAALGLNVAATSVETFGGIPALVVERYDRKILNGVVERVHQEDFCQALGIHPSVKYENDGGPGITDSMALLGKSIPVGRAKAARLAFLQANAFNWLIEGTDAHAKNYSLLHTPTGSNLAPFYDVASALPYLGQPGWVAQKIKLAMKAGGHYRVQEIEGRHWAAAAEKIGASPEEFVALLRTMAEGLPDALRAAAAGLQGVDLDHDAIARFVAVGAERADVVRQSLEG